MKSAFKFLALVIAAVLLGSVAPPRPRAQDQSSQGQTAEGQTAQGQSQPAQQSDKEQQKKKKKGGGFFGGMKAITGASSEQTSATASAGTKGVGEGAQIGDAQPTAADRQMVSAMEGYSIPPAEVKKFQEDGKLQSKQ